MNALMKEVRDTAGSYALAEDAAVDEAVPAGYKRTEVGVIPEDWAVCDIGDFKPFVTSGSRGWADYYSNRGSTFLRITNMSRDSICVDLSDLKLVNLPPDSTEGVRTQLQDGDLLVSITADIGIIAFVDASVPKPAYINQHIALVRLDPAKVDSKFLSYFLASEGAQRFFRASTDQGAKAGMNLANVREIKAAFPVLAEQRAIASALSDVDALLVGLDQLIAKKRDLKQAAMQQLLTGNNYRLPGFTTKWETKQLGEIFSISAGRSKTAHIVDAGRFWIVDMGSVSAKGRLVVSKATNYHGDFLDAGDLVMPKDDIGGGNIIGKVGYIDADKTYVLGDHVYRLSPKMGDSKYLSYAINGYQTNSELRKKVIGSAQLGLGRRSVNEQEVSFPPLEEQTALATILSDMDAELATLEARRDKTRELKQGMMQALLTGRIRLT